MKQRELLRKLNNKLFSALFKFQRTYSQCGEDVIINFLMENHFKINKPTYIDIGAHHPYNISNTAYFYAKGCHGINIEPNPVLFKSFLKYRKHDINLNIGISDSEGTLPFYVLNASTMSTFSKDECDDMIANHGFRLEAVVDVKVKSFTAVIEEHAGGITTDILTLDAEGVEDKILRSIDFLKNRPKIICLETAKYATSVVLDNKERDLVDYLREKGYKTAADTFINTILIDDYCMRGK